MNAGKIALNIAFIILFTSFLVQEHREHREMTGYKLLFSVFIAWDAYTITMLTIGDWK